MYSLAKVFEGCSRVRSIFLGSIWTFQLFIFHYYLIYCVLVLSLVFGCFFIVYGSEVALPCPEELFTDPSQSQINPVHPSQSFLETSS
jgi:hypothetical protein